MKPDDKNGGPNYLAEWREFRQLTQMALAELVGTNANMISYLESGERGLSARWLRRLAAALDTSPGMLLDQGPQVLNVDLVTAMNFQEFELMRGRGSTKSPPHYLREWRKHRGMTQDQVACRLTAIEDESLPQTGASLSRLENGKQPYAQHILEALAEIYKVAPADLLKSGPDKKSDVVDLLHGMDERKRAQAFAIIKALAET